MTDSWMTAIETLIERWRAESEPVELPEPSSPKVSAPPAAAGAVSAADLHPALSKVSREHRQGLAELAEVVRGSMAALAESLRAWSERTPDRPAVDDGGRLAAEVGGRIDGFREEMKVALARFAESMSAPAEGRAGAEAPPAPVTARELADAVRPMLAELGEEVRKGSGGDVAQAVRGAFAEALESVKSSLDATGERIVERHREEITRLGEEVRKNGGDQLSATVRSAMGEVLEAIKSALEAAGERIAERNREDVAKLGDAVRSYLTEFSEEDMVGRAGLAKSIKIGMADLAEKSRRSLIELQEALAPKTEGDLRDTVIFHPEPIPDPAFDSAGKVGAFPRAVGDEVARQISISDCYAAQAADDSMAPLACEGHTLLVSRSVPVKNGDLVLAQLDDDQWVFRRYVHRGGLHQLQSLNPQLGLPAVVLDGPPQRVHVVVGVIFGSAQVRARLAAEASAAAGAGSD